VASTAEESTPAEDTATGKLSPEDREEVTRLIRQGVAALTAGDMRQCVLFLEEASLLAPEHPALLYYYGMAYDKLQNPKKAREYYTRLFQMRDQAGSYFKRAAHRLTYGFDQSTALRGKLSFGPHQLRHEYSPETGERVDMLLPVLLAPGEEVRPEDIYITLQFFDLVSGRRIEFSRMASPQLTWQNESPTWSNWEENLVVSYHMPPLTDEQLNAYGDLRYYGFTAKLYYKGEPLDCISTPSALILQEQILNRRQARRNYTPSNNLLPDDGLVPEYEEALPASDFLPELPLPQ
jgi:tetratricopeptide (TPR) repeat protein